MEEDRATSQEKPGRARVPVGRASVQTGKVRITRGQRLARDSEDLQVKRRNEQNVFKNLLFASRPEKGMELFSLDPEGFRSKLGSVKATILKVLKLLDTQNWVKVRQSGILGKCKTKSFFNLKTREQLKKL